MKGILGRKVGMTQVFTKDGKLIPVTVVSVEPNVVMQVKTLETDGYSAIQLGVEDKKEKNATKASIGHAKKAGTNPKRFLKEIRDVEASYNVGDKIGAEIFTVGEVVDVTGTSKGKGWAGVIKRWNFHRLRESHGSGPVVRHGGSIGQCSDPSRVYKGLRSAGHLGHEKVTVQNLTVIKVLEDKNLIAIKGSIPGPKGSIVYIKDSVKISPREGK